MLSVCVFGEFVYTRIHHMACKAYVCITSVSCRIWRHYQWALVCIHTYHWQRRSGIRLLLFQDVLVQSQIFLIWFCSVGLKLHQKSRCSQFANLELLCVRYGTSHGTWVCTYMYNKCVQRDFAPSSNVLRCVYIHLLPTISPASAEYICCEYMFTYTH